ncbi:hypothetical protein KC354_g77 [Hortaea werneckii]|nr:hypothetical protein KC354_g77 [Hortaea werneckii]
MSVLASFASMSAATRGSTFETLMRRLLGPVVRELCKLVKDLRRNCGAVATMFTCRHSLLGCNEAIYNKRLILSSLSIEARIGLKNLHSQSFKSSPNNAVPRVAMPSPFNVGQATNAGPVQGILMQYRSCAIPIRSNSLAYARADASTA